MRNPGDPERGLSIPIRSAGRSGGWSVRLGAAGSEQGLKNPCWSGRLGIRVGVAGSWRRLEYPCSGGRSERELEYWRCFEARLEYRHPCARLKRGLERPCSCARGCAAVAGQPGAAACRERGGVSAMSLALVFWRVFLRAESAQRFGAPARSSHILPESAPCNRCAPSKECDFGEAPGVWTVKPTHGSNMTVAANCTSGRRSIASTCDHHRPPVHRSRLAGFRSAAA
ncbi:hypothetical protein DFR70_110173 [Nocardia tenerifensis]|uniref:Uncharacterized protein n=1 Tax=Nocardia tenerifensis TaxID=228006 RepID=A0A318K8H1_9NOCA|nr:hypothetical protein DFR70_110173 [Nocardia tenerifensis]